MSARVEPRVQCVLPVRITGTDSQGNRFERLTCTLDISDRGARITGITDKLRPGMALQVHRKNRRGKFRVAWVGQAGTRTENRIGLLVDSKEAQFWPELRKHKSGPDADDLAKRERQAQRQVQDARPQVSVPANPPASNAQKATERMKAATEEMLELAKLIERGAVEPAALQEFRQALGYVRNTSWMLQQLIELRQNGRERLPLPLLTMLNTERLRLAASLCNDLAGFLSTAKVRLDVGLTNHFIAAVRQLLVILTTSQPGGIRIDDMTSRSPGKCDC
jgi:hypothetical protein